MPQTPEQRRAWYAEHREEIRERKRAYAAANRDEIREQARAYAAANREKIRAQNKAAARRHYVAHAAQRNALQRELEAAHPEWLERSNAKQRADQAETLAHATRYRQQWTGPELEIVARTDLTTKQIALTLGRTRASVMHARRKLRDEPKFQMLAGLTDAQRQDMGMPGKQVSYG